MTNAIITKTYNESAVLAFREDGWFNMTKAAKAFGKDLSNFMRLPSTLEYTEALALSVKITDKELVEIKRGNGQLPQVGTWAHPKLAVFFARWLDTKFAIWCDTVIDDILRGKAEVVITKPETSEIMKMPTSLPEAGRLWVAEMERAETLQLENAKQAKALAIAAPKADFYDALVETEAVYTPTEVANMLGMDKYRSGMKVNLLMVKMGWQYKKGTHWYATAEAGYTPINKRNHHQDLQRQHRAAVPQ